MKKYCLILVLIGATSAAVAAAESTQTLQSDYARAVQTYVNAATDQLRAIRSDVDARLGKASGEDTKKRYELVYAKLGQTDRVLADLKNAGPENFDRIKLQFEQSLAETINAVQVVAQG